MHLRVQIDWRQRRGLSCLFVLIVELTLLTSRIEWSDAETLDQLQKRSNQFAQDEVALKRLEQARERKCIPMLNILLPQPRSLDGNRDLGQVNTNRAPRSLAPTTPDNFTFSIGDIDVPLTQVGSPIQSAMRLLSSFDSSFDGDDDEMEASADGESPQQHRDSSIKFVHNKLHIADLNLTMLNFHLYDYDQPRFGLGVNIGNATLTGKFFYDGLTPSLMGGDLMSRLAGHYRMSIDNVLVTASSNISYLLADAGSQYPHQLVTNDFKMDISNLGYISIDILDAKDSTKQTSNYVLKMLQRVLQKTIKRTYNKFESYIRETLEREGRQFLDCELTRFTPLLKGYMHKEEEDSVMSAQQGMPRIWRDLELILSSEIRNSRLDCVAMPSFEYQRTVLGTTALIVFTNGSLSGLDKLRLLGETKVKLQQEHLIVNASLGWSGLRPQYNWTLYLGNSATKVAQRLDSTQDVAVNASSSMPKPAARGFVAANINQIEFDTLISRTLGQSHPRVTVDELVIKRLDGPKLDIGGLPGMNRIARATVNFFMARLKQRLVNSVQPALKSGLERVLNNLSTPLR